MLKCPVCRATYRPQNSSRSCHRCGADLAPLIQLHDRAIDHHRKAIALLSHGDVRAALETNAQAIALHAQHPKFHALAGQLWALQGNFDAAWRSWQIAQQLDPKDATVNACLELMEKLAIE
jgi:Tfp pilus assembly protein PilF